MRRDENGKHFENYRRDNVEIDYIYIKIILHWIWFRIRFV